MNKRTRVTAGAVLAAGLGSLAYPLFFRDWCLTWGARPDEVSRKLPGDELLAEPDIVTTRAIWIDAPAGSVWPWLVQMGPGRAGAYTYDWIENLFGLGMHSADQILTRYQDLKVGDAQQLGRRGPVLRVAVLEPEQSLVLRSDDGNWVWAFSLVPQGAWVRLISRNRIATPGAPLPVRLFNTLVMEPGSLIMERKMLLGIKERAKRLAGERAAVAPALQQAKIRGDAHRPSVRVLIAASSLSSAPARRQAMVQWAGSSITTFGQRGRPRSWALVHSSGALRP